MSSLSSKKQSKISTQFITNMNNRLKDMENRVYECCKKKSPTADSFNSADDTYDPAPSGSWWVHMGLKGLSPNKTPIKYLKSKKRYDYAFDNEKKHYGPEIGYEFEREEVINDEGDFLEVKMDGKNLYLPKKIGTEDVLKYIFPGGKGKKRKKSKSKNEKKQKSKKKPKKAKK